MAFTKIVSEITLGKTVCTIGEYTNAANETFMAMQLKGGFARPVFVSAETAVAWADNGVVGAEIASAVMEHLYPAVKDKLELRAEKESRKAILKETREKVKALKAEIKTLRAA